MSPASVQSSLQRYLLQLILGQISGSDKLWVGLLTAELSSNATLADAIESELHGSGYSRLALQSDAWSLTERPLQAVTREPLIIRNGGTKPWPIVRAAFLATTSGNEGVLIMTQRLGADRLLLPGDVLRIELQLAFA